jgi:Family of unknown function (DUF6174)
VSRATRIALLATLALVSCAREPHPDLTTSNLAKWNASGISNYEFSIIQYAYSPEAPPMRVVVENGAIQSATLLCLNTENYCREWTEQWKDIYGPDKLPTYARTIPQLFELMSRIRDHPYDRDARVLAEFDPTYGFPTRFSFDNPNTSDDEYSFEISDFTVIQ